METPGVYKFDDFVIDPVRRQLCRLGTPVPVPQKAFQVLLFLAENPGRVLTKRELMSAVWPKSFVEEANLTQSIFLLRRALCEQPGQSRYILTVPGEGYQFAVHPVLSGPANPLPAVAEIGRDSAGASNHLTGSIDAEVHKEALPRPEPIREVPPVRERRLWRRAALSAGIILLVGGTTLTFWYLRQHRRGTALQGSVVLADFANSTGDPAFNAALKEGLASDLQQSPNLGVISDTRIAQTLKLMVQPAEAALTPSLAREVCQRTGSEASVEGSIGRLGTEYVVGLRALECRSGDVLAQDQETAGNKEQVLRALGLAASKLRRRLGESLPSLQRYDTAPQDITTGSLDALQAYGLGVQAQIRGNCPAAIVLFKRAISLDPDFAMAYSHLGVCDSSSEGVAATEKAYMLRGRVSDRERLYLESHYEQYATGDLTAARKILETWAETYPHDGDFGPNLLKLYLTTGEYERALPLVRTIVQNSPATPGNNAARLATTLLFLNRVQEAKAVLLNAIAHHDDAPVSHFYLYEIYFLENDSAAMAAEASTLRSQPGWEGNVLDLESVTASDFGKFTLARSLSDQAIQSAVREQNWEDAGGFLVEASMQEALAGNRRIALQKAKAGLALSRTSGVEPLAGMAQALAGDALDAEHTAVDLNQRLPKDTMAQVAVATIHACDLLSNEKSRDQGRRAIDVLGPARPYMLGANFSLVPVYVLGNAYLAAGQSASASEAFREILGHPGVTRNYITGPLARLGLAKAEEQAGKLLEAKADYTEFLRLWRDADATVPVLIEAKSSLKRVDLELARKLQAAR